MMISCKKATYLICKKEEVQLSFLEKVKLQLHLSICKFCRLFKLQTTFIDKNAVHSNEHIGNLHLPDSAKEKISQVLKNAIE